MGRPLALCAGVCVLAMLVPAAWPQAAPTPATTAAPEQPAAPAAPEDPLAAAMATVKAPVVARATHVAAARNYLVDQRLVARPLIVQLLSDDDAQVRMNAAIVLAQMAAAGDLRADPPGSAGRREGHGILRGVLVFRGLMSDDVPRRIRAW